MYIRASSSYKDAHSGASASGLWEASQNKTMQSYNHIPFYLEHKGFFVTHIPESCVSLFSPRDLNLEHSKAFPSWYHLFVCFFFLLFSFFLSLLPPSKAGPSSLLTLVNPIFASQASVLSELGEMVKIIASLKDGGK